MSAEKAPDISSEPQQPSKELAPAENEVNLEDQKPEEVLPDQNAQHGVRTAEAMTLAWTKKSLIAVYICMFLMYLVNAFQLNITSNLTAYVTSDFSEHALIPVMYIVTYAMAAACFIPICKILDTWDRAAGFSLMTSIGVLGLILMAVCNNIGTYSAASVFTTVGLTGMIYCVDVITADTSSLRNRGLAFAFTSSPYIITAFAGSKASEGFYQSNWRWGFGSFALILPFVAAPMVTVMLLARHKAKKQGLLIKGNSNRTWVQSILHYAVEFDLIGVILFALGLVLFLLPFAIASSTASEWRSGSIIAMIIMGGLILISFAFWERFGARRPFLPYHLITDRTIIALCLIDICYQIAYYCWDSYYTSYLQVVYNVSISSAGYINGTFDIISSIWLLGAGFLMRYTGRFKWLVLCAVPLYILGQGLMIYFRNPGWSVGYQVMCNIFMAFGGGTLILCQQIGVMSVANHSEVASVLALMNIIGNVGGAIGSSISGAIWTNTFADALQRMLPPDVVDSWEDIYEDLTVQLSYPVGSDARNAIGLAYAYTQKRMLIAGTSIMCLSLIWMLLIRNVNLKGNQQVKGVLF